MALGGIWADADEDEAQYRDRLVTSLGRKAKDLGYVLARLCLRPTRRAVAELARVPTGANKLRNSGEFRYGRVRFSKLDTEFTKPVFK